MCTRHTKWRHQQVHAADCLAIRTFCGLPMDRTARTVCPDHEPELYGVSCGACKRTNAYKACVTEAALAAPRTGLRGLMDRVADGEFA